MRLYHYPCKEPIHILTEFVVELLSNFTLSEDAIHLTKHVIKGSKGLRPTIKSDDFSKIKFWCRYCKKEVDLEDARCQCDNCKCLSPYKEIEMVGETIHLCYDCAKKQKRFSDFSIFIDTGEKENVDIDIDDGAEPNPVGNFDPGNLIADEYRNLAENEIRIRMDRR